MRSLFAIVVCLLIAAPVAGQEQRGSIKGSPGIPPAPSSPA